MQFKKEGTKDVLPLIFFPLALDSLRCSKPVWCQFSGLEHRMEVNTERISLTEVQFSQFLFPFPFLLLRSS